VQRRSVKIMNKLPKDRGRRMEYFEIPTFKKSKEHLRHHTLDSEFAYIGKKTLKNSII
jgi:hypothetical protein